MVENKLEGIIIERIKREGPVSFRDFMEMCLYYPGLGYYTSSSERIGKKGDYYTTSCMHSLFGAMIGRQLEEMWTNLDKNPFTIVEYGAGTGRLCSDILGYLRVNEEMLGSLKYYIIEKSPAMRKRQQLVLPPIVKWI